MRRKERPPEVEPMPDRAEILELVERFRGADIPDHIQASKEIEAAIGDEVRGEMVIYRMARGADQPLETLVDWVMQAIRERGGQ